MARAPRGDMDVSIAAMFELAAVLGVPQVDVDQDWLLGCESAPNNDPS